MVKEFLSRQQKDKSSNQQIEMKKQGGPLVQSNKNDTIPTSSTYEMHKTKINWRIVV